MIISPSYPEVLLGNFGFPARGFWVLGGPDFGHFWQGAQKGSIPNFGRKSTKLGRIVRFTYKMTQNENGAGLVQIRKLPKILRIFVFEFELSARGPDNAN